MEACFKEAWVMEVNPFSVIWCQDEHPYVGNHVWCQGEYAYVGNHVG